MKKYLLAMQLNLPEIAAGCRHCRVTVAHAGWVWRAAGMGGGDGGRRWVQGRKAWGVKMDLEREVGNGCEDGGGSEGIAMVVRFVRRSRTKAVRRSAWV